MLPWPGVCAWVLCVLGAVVRGLGAEGGCGADSSLVLYPLPCALLLIIRGEHALRALVRMCLIKITRQR